MPQVLQYPSSMVPVAPLIDPMLALMSPAVVAENKRFCARCGAPVGRGRDGQPGRTEGFCPQCRTQYSFSPSCTPETCSAASTRSSGCLAHGGLGWIYLARDRNVSDRWVVLKGLLNTGDDDAIARPRSPSGGSSPRSSTRSSSRSTTS